MLLTQIESEITSKVVDRFLSCREATSRKSMVDEFQDPDAIDVLVRYSILKQNDDQRQYLPRVLAFHCSGHAKVRFRARTSFQLVLRVLKRLHKTEPENTQHTTADIEQTAREMGEAVVPEMISLGLYVAEEFSVLGGCNWNPEHNEIVSFTIREEIVKIKNIETAWDERIRQNSESIEAQRGPELEPGNPTPPLNVGASKLVLTTANSRKVFLVHGHNNEVKQTVARFLETLNLEVVILHEQLIKGRTVIENFEEYSDVAFAVVLLTPDDFGGSNSKRKTSNKRARQNVILELGYFIGRLGRERVCALHVEGVELPSDIKGVLYIAYDSSGGWHLKLAREIMAAGIEVDLNRIVRF